jgi:hypothetical protein
MLLAMWMDYGAGIVAGPQLGRMRLSSGAVHRSVERMSDILRNDRLPNSCSDSRLI